MISNSLTVATTKIEREQLFQRLFDREQILLTASNRQARYWSQQYHQWAESRSNVWSKPNILPLNTWLNQLYQSVALTKEVPRKLSRSDSLRQWQGIIEKTIDSNQLISEQTTARKAYEAFQFHNLYKIPFDKPAFADLDQDYFYRWRKIYENQCIENNWLDDAKLSSWLVEHLSTEMHIHEYLPNNISLLGFSEIEPAKSDLFEYLAQTFKVHWEVLSMISNISAQQVNDQSQLAICDDPQQEIYRAANWALLHLQKNPNKKLAILVPELEQNRSQIAQWMSHVFHPDALAEPRLQQPVFNISVGRPLNHLSGARIAVNLIKWLFQPLSIDAISELTNSSCLGVFKNRLTQNHHYQLKQWVFQLPSETKKTYSFDQWCDQLLFMVRKDEELNNTANVSKLSDWLTELRKIKQASGNTRSLFNWSGIFKQWLMLWGWFDSTHLSSYQYQLRSSIFDLLQSLRNQVLVDRKLTGQATFKLLSELFSNASFQPKSLGEPIQVMGLLEAVCIEFDAVWITGLTNHLYPSTPQPNPFIPPPTAKRYGIPGSSPERELLFTRELFSKLKLAAKDRVVSYSKMDDDRELGPSPLIYLITGEQALNDNGATQPMDPLSQMFEVELQKYDDSQGIEYHRAQLARAIAFFQSQAECPTKAYLAHRVNLQKQEQAEEGISPLDRGTFVHRVLQVLWQRIQTQQNLLSMDEKEEWDIIYQAINDSDDQSLSRHHLLTQIEHKRYAHLIKQLLTLEKSRPSFRVVATEKEETINFAGLIFTTRLDRIDEIDGEDSVAIIDYKTGKVASTKWFDERITDPQLPLYALNAQKPVGVLAFASLHPKDLKFDGVVNESSIFSKLMNIEKKTKGEISNWQGFMEHVHNDLSIIATEIKQGYAALTPKNNQVCQYCDFAAVCRINEFITIDDEDTPLMESDQ